LTGVLLALGASLAWGFADFGAGWSTRRLPVFVVAAVSQTAGLVVVGLVVLASESSLPSPGGFAWGLSAGVVGIVGLASFYKGLAIGTMGVVGPISSTAAVVPVIYGLGSGERPSSVQGVGVGLAVLGVVAASLEPVPHGRGRRLGTGVGLALLAALSFGWSLVGLNEAANGGSAAWATFSMRLSAVPLVIVLALALGPRLPASRRAWLILLGVGVADTAATLLYALASTKGLLSVVSVLASLYPIVLVVLGRVLLDERIARPQLAGVGVALAGVALISAG